MGFILLKTKGLHRCNLALIQGPARVQGSTTEGFHSNLYYIKIAVCCRQAQLLFFIISLFTHFAKN